MTDQSQRDKMLQRVMNLRARAEDDAASEGEMNTALTMAGKLMDSYNIEEAELALAETEGRIVLEVVNKVADTSAKKGKQRHKIVAVLGSIGAFTETRVIYNQGNGDITFTGHRPDTELANYVVAVVREALDREYDTYRARNTAVGYGAKASFQTAMASRISSRLFQMTQERADAREADKQEAKKMQIENASTASSTALVISDIAEQKREEVNAAYSKSFPNVRRGAGFNYGRNRSAHSAGNSAGNNVNLGRAIGQNASKQLA